MRQWTKEYQGVTHLDDTPRNIVATVTRYESGASFTLADLHRPNPFSSGKNEWFPGKRGFKQAKAQAEYDTREWGPTV
jgi:hypothetical protein